MSIFSFVKRLFGSPNRVSAEEFVTGRRTSDIVVDVRTSAEFSRGHIAGARNIGVRAADFETQVERLMRTSRDDDVRVYLYCRSGARSGRAARALEARGLEQVFNAGAIGRLEAAGADVRR